MAINRCTLWTDFCLYEKPYESMKIARASLSDYREIYFTDHPLTPEQTQEVHAKSRRWLYKSIEQAKEQVNIVITHHLPSKKAIQPEYFDSILSPAYASHCSEFEDLTDKIAIWFYGHNHDCREFIDFGIKFHTNQRGYCGFEEVPGFNPIKKMIIDSQ